MRYPRCHARSVRSNITADSFPRALAVTAVTFEHYTFQLLRFAFYTARCSWFVTVCDALPQPCRIPGLIYRTVAVAYGCLQLPGHVVIATRLLLPGLRCPFGRCLHGNTHARSQPYRCGLLLVGLPDTFADIRVAGFGLITCLRIYVHTFIVGWLPFAVWFRYSDARLRGSVPAHRRYVVVRLTRLLITVAVRFDLPICGCTAFRLVPLPADTLPGLLPF